MRRRQSRVLVVFSAVALGLLSPLTAQVAVQGSPKPTVAEHQAFLNKYCVTCHNQKLKTAGLVLEGISLDDLSGRAEVWEKVIQKLRVGMMPPQGAPRPDQAANHRMVEYLTARLDRAALASPNPGRPLIHRLNRAEYANALRDLLALDVDSTALLPPDDSGYGFDNVADALGISPVLLESYVNAASKVSGLAVGAMDVTPGGMTYRARPDTSQNVHIEGQPLGTVGGILARPTLQVDGEYVLQAKLFRNMLGVMRGLERTHQLEMTVDGERVHLASFGGDADFKLELKNMTAAADAVDSQLKARVHIKAGPHVIGVDFLSEGDVTNTVRWQPSIKAPADADPAGPPQIDSFTIAGPFNPTGPGNTPSRQKIFICRPAKVSEEDACATKILTALVHRAYRGLDTETDRSRLLKFYHAGRRESFDKGIELALERILASPKFLFRSEDEPDNLTAGASYRISDFDLASRLSFFLWSTIPDDQLLDLASRGQLKNPAVLEKQVRRMLLDPKSEALVSNFAGQWLYLRNLRAMVPDLIAFPDFDNNLREAFLREAELFFGSVMREDRNVVDLMTADYTFVNERLARHYGIPGVYGTQFRRVKVTEEARKGLLGKGAILMVSSHTDRTSPVVRGKWILDNLLDAPPPPMPQNVPPLNESNERAGKVLTMRERMEEHRSDPYCASCHKMMDPIGFAMENFDAVGAWRTYEGNAKDSRIDASGQLLDGSKVNGPVELRQALLREPDIFVSTMTEKLLTYALGRGVLYYDMPVVRSIVRESAGQNYRFSSIVLGIVRSAPFQMRVKSAEGSERVPVKTASRN